MKKYASEIEYRNDYNRKKYDRVGLMLPKGKASEWKVEAEARNTSLNALVISAVEEYLKKMHSSEK